MGSAESDFLAAGVRLFPDAHAAVEQFRRLLRDRVDAVLRAFETDAWTVPAGAEFKSSKGGTDGLWCGAYGRVQLSRPQLANAVLDVGLWWNSSSIRAHPTVFCAYFDDGPSDLLRKLRVVDGNGVEELRVGATTHAIAPPSANGNLDDDLRRVIAALASAVRACPTT